MTSPAIITLSELSDTDPEIRHENSPRLDAVISRLPKFHRVRIVNCLLNAGIHTLDALCAKKRAELLRWKNVGRRSVADLEGTLALFGLSLADVPAIVVPDHGTPLDAHIQRLHRWIDGRLARFEDVARRGKSPEAATEHEQRVLTDIMLILDGREPSVEGLMEHMPPDKIQTPSQRVTNPVWLRAQIGKLIESCAENITEDQRLADQERDETRRERYLARVEGDRHWKWELERILRGKTFAEEFSASVKSQRRRVVR